MKARYDYLPYGEELGSGIGSRTIGMGYSAADSTRQKFTSKERDNESGLDYFGARYYASPQGRFTSVDPSDPILNRQASANRQNAQSEFISWISNPQRWNKYPYVLNNPFRYIDQDGRDPEDPLVILNKALQRLNRFAELAEGFLKSGRTNLIGVATQLALEAIFGKTIAFTPTGLSAAEAEFAKEVTVFEGRGFLGTAKSQQGIDGVLHDGILPTSNPQPVQLQENSTGGEYRIMSDAVRHENSASGIGLKNIDLYVKSTDKNVTVSSVLKFIEGGGSSGLRGITSRGTFKTITIFTQDGVVRIEKDKVTAILR